MFKLIDRSYTEHEVYPMLLKDCNKIAPIMPKILNILMMSELKQHIYKGDYDKEIYTTIDQYKALYEFLKISTKKNVNEINDCFDLAMAKQALCWFIGHKTAYYNISYIEVDSEYSINEKLTISCIKQILEEKDMINELKVGTTITDRNGKEYIAYSYLLKEYNEAMELLGKIDMVNISENIDESFDALVEIIYRSLNKKVSKKEIIKSLDAEFAKKVIRVFFDLPQLN